MHTMVVKTMALLLFFFRSLDHKLLGGVQKPIDRLQSTFPGAQEKRCTLKLIWSSVSSRQ